MRGSGEAGTRRRGDAGQRVTCKRSVRNLHRNHSSEHNASKEGVACPRSIRLTLNVEWKDIELGQATLPYCVYASLSYFDEA